jgi:SAM-dependent methyltransferase
LAYHEKLYAGSAQAHFSRPAVRAFRDHLAGRILSLTGVRKESRILSLGCGTGDAELVLAPHVGELVGVDLSPAGVKQAREDARRLGISNVDFIQGTLSAVQGRFDAVIAIFFLHHLSDQALLEVPDGVAERLRPSGLFYSLDPSAHRLSGKVGRLLIPGLMKKYQTEDERELDPAATAGLFRQRGFAVTPEVYDFGSTPVAGLFPGWKFGYRLARRIDDALLKVPPLRRWGSNFEILGRRVP